MYTHPGPAPPRRPRARARGAAGRAPGVGPPRSALKPAPHPHDRAVPRSPGVVRAPARARPRAACVRPTAAPGRAAAASDRVALNRLTRRQVRAIRGAASAARPAPRGCGSARAPGPVPPAPPVPPVEFIPAPCVCDSDCSQAPSHTLDGRGQSHTHMIAAIHSLTAPAIRLRGSPPAAAHSYTLCYDGL